MTKITSRPEPVTTKNGYQRLANGDILIPAACVDGILAEVEQVIKLEAEVTALRAELAEVKRDLAIEVGADPDEYDQDQAATQMNGIERLTRFVTNFTPPTEDPVFFSRDFFIAYEPRRASIAKSASAECLIHDVTKWIARQPIEYVVGCIEDLGEDPGRPGVHRLHCKVTPKAFYTPTNL